MACGGNSAEPVAEEPTAQLVAKKATAEPVVQQEPTEEPVEEEPAESVRGRIKFTEQGEAITNRYANLEISHRHLEQIVNAILLSSGKRPTHRPSRGGEWEAAMQALSPLAEQNYRAFIHDSAPLLRYFQEATPTSEIGGLNIGSRPAKRRDTKGIQDLRAIPWVFAWMQSRVTIPSWYPLGSAFNQWASEGADEDQEEQKWALLSSMYHNWPFFRTMINNAQMGMRKADMLIANVYSSLTDPETRTEIFLSLRTEYERTEKAILRLTGQQDLLDNQKWIQDAIRLRNPYIDPMNYIQVALLHRLRDDPTGPEAEKLRQTVLLSVNGIAAGLRNTG